MDFTDYDDFINLVKSKDFENAADAMDFVMFNVGFGECGLLRKGGESLLVDFGSDSPDKISDKSPDEKADKKPDKSIDESRVLSETFIKIAFAIGTRSPSFLLTHFHEDHMNGLYAPINVKKKLKQFNLLDMLLLSCLPNLNYSKRILYLLTETGEKRPDKKGSDWYHIFYFALSFSQSFFGRDNFDHTWCRALLDEDFYPGYFKNIYMPDIFGRKLKSSKIDYAHLFILKDIFDGIILRKKRAINRSGGNQPEKGSEEKTGITLFKLLKRLTTWGSQIFFLKKEDKFSLDSTKFEVLWPNFDCMGIDPETEEQIWQLLTKLKKIRPLPEIRGKEDLDKVEKNDLGIIGEFTWKLSRAFVLLQKLRTPEEKELTDRERRDDEKKRSDIQKELDLIIIDLNNMEEAIAQWAEAVSESLSGREFASLARELIKTGNKLVKEGNKISIVFHDTGDGDSSKILMTGDITKPELKKMIKNGDLKKHYTLIKAPHHGTETYFVKNLPACEIMAVSNGPTTHPKWGKIDREYCTGYVPEHNCEMMCTNPRCKLLCPQNNEKAPEKALYCCNSVGKKHETYLTLDGEVSFFRVELP